MIENYLHEVNEDFEIEKEKRNGVLTTNKELLIGFEKNLFDSDGIEFPDLTDTSTVKLFLKWDKHQDKIFSTLNLKKFSNKNSLE
jgi:hypothetical protein